MAQHASASGSGNRTIEGLHEDAVRMTWGRDALRLPPLDPLWTRNDGVFGILNMPHPHHVSTAQERAAFWQLFLDNRIIKRGNTTPEHCAKLWKTYVDQLKKVQDNKCGGWKSIPMEDLVAIRTWSAYQNERSGLRQGAPPQTVRAIRQGGARLTDHQLLQYVPGAVIRNREFMSTVTSPAVSYCTLREKYNAQFIIKGNPVELGYASLYDGWEEVALFFSGTPMIVRKVKYLGSGHEPAYPQVNIWMDEVAPSAFAS